MKQLLMIIALQLLRHIDVVLQVLLEEVRQE